MLYIASYTLYEMILPVLSHLAIVASGVYSRREIEDFSLSLFDEIISVLARRTGAVLRLYACH